MSLKCVIQKLLKLLKIILTVSVTYDFKKLLVLVRLIYIKDNLYYLEKLFKTFFKEVVFTVFQIL